MANILESLSKEKTEEIEGFLIERFKYLQELRAPFDSEIESEVKMYNNIDENIRGKEEWEEKYEIPYTYTIVQTMAARIMAGLFGNQNYLKVYGETSEFKDIEREISSWLQTELDKLNFKSRSRDFVEDALVKRISWLQLRPMQLDKKVKVEFDILDFFDVWFDTKAKEVMNSDFFVKKLKKLYEIKGHPELYSNIEEVQDYEGQDSDHANINAEYQAKHSGKDGEPTYTKFQSRNNATDEVEILEYYGIYDMSEEDISDPTYKGDMKEIIFTLANREKLIRVEINNLKTKRKRLLFPIRPLRQANSLIGKGVSQLTRKLAEENNETRSLRMQNFKLLIKLLFKYDVNADIDVEELHASGGNAIGYDGAGNKNAVDIMNVPNLIREASAMVGEGVQDMQQVTGSVDYVMGTSAGRGITETASGISSITEQAMFKFSMMIENTYDDILDFINFVAILKITHGGLEILEKYPKLDKLVKEVPLEELEDSHLMDIELKDVSQRRDVERNQWANMMGIIDPMVKETGGNRTELLKQFLDVFQVPNSDKILQPEDPQAIALKLMQNPQLMQMVMQMVQSSAAGGEGGKNQSSQAADVKGGDAIENAGNENIKQRG